MHQTQVLELQQLGAELEVQLYIAEEDGEKQQFGGHELLYATSKENTRGSNQKRWCEMTSFIRTITRTDLKVCWSSFTSFVYIPRSCMCRISKDLVLFAIYLSNR
ncbi:hypothetical protein MKX01_028539 [Papaver californicum]|nr:hypothetical protein MKX01_028539 [Papaver californicum]